MNNIDKEIAEYFDNQEIPQLADHDHARLRNLVKANASRKKINICKRLTLIACSFCMILLAVIPTLALIANKDTTPPPTIYYGELEATKLDLTEQEAYEIISTRYPKYEFIFEGFTFYSLLGYYIPNTNELLSISIKSVNDSTNTIIEFNLIASKQFIFNQKEMFIKDAENITTNDYKMYKKIISGLLNKTMYGYIIYPNHELYITLNTLNEDLFNQFI